MRSISQFCFIVLIVLLPIACTQQPGDKGYTAWVEDYRNGLHVSSEHNDLVMDLQYQPAEYVYMQRHGDFDQAGFEKEKEELNQIQHYILTIRAKDKSDLLNTHAQDASDKQRLLYYFSYLFQQDIQLEENGEQLSCILYHFERNADLRNSHSFVLGFENKNSSKSHEAQLILRAAALSALPVKIKVLKGNASVFEL